MMKTASLYQSDLCVQINHFVVVSSSLCIGKARDDRALLKTQALDQATP